MCVYIDSPLVRQRSIYVLTEFVHRLVWNGKESRKLFDDFQEFSGNYHHMTTTTTKDTHHSIQRSGCVFLFDSILRRLLLLRERVRTHLHSLLTSEPFQAYETKTHCIYAWLAKFIETRNRYRSQ